MERKSFKTRLLAMILVVGLILGNSSMSVFAAGTSTAKPQETGITALAEYAVAVEVDSQGNFLTSLETFESQIKEMIGTTESLQYKYGTTALSWGALSGTALVDPEGVFGKIEKTPGEVTNIEVRYQTGSSWGMPQYATFTIRVSTVLTTAEENIIAVISENGTVSGGKYADGQVSVLEGETVSLTFKPDNNYYISQITVDETEIEPEYADGTATVKLDAEQAMTVKNIAAEYAPMFVLKEGAYEVSMKDGADLSAIRTQLEESILMQAVNKDESAEMESINVKFKSIMGTELTSSWENLDQQYVGALGVKGHKFGSRSPEKIQLSFDGNDRLPKASVEFSVNVNIVEKELSKLVFDEIALTYNEDAAAQKEQIFNAINREESILPEDVTADDLKVEYRFKLSIPFVDESQIPNIPGVDNIFIEMTGNNVIPAGSQTIRVTYRGNAEYKEYTTEEIPVTVAKAEASVTVNSQTITYGEKFDPIVTTTPEGVSTLTVITGVDASVNPYVSIILPEIKAAHINTGVSAIDNVINGMIDTAVNAANSALESILNSGGTLKDTLTAICNNKELAEMIGIDLSSVEQLLQYLPAGVADIKVNVNRTPEEAGVYAVAAVTLDPNYKTAFGIGGLVINMDTDHKIGWKQELPTMLNWKRANIDNEYDFGAEFKEEDVTAEIKYEFAGFSNDGKFHTNTKPILEPGIYTETAYLYLGNEYAVPIVRSYTVGRMHTVCEDLKAEKVYDGLPMDERAIFKLIGEDGNEITDGSYELTYFNQRTNQVESSAPAEVGEYTVKGIYCGDAFHRQTVICAGFRIVPDEVIIEIQDVSKVYGEEDPIFTYVAKDSNGNVLDRVFDISLLRETGENAGAYAITGALSGTVDPNYTVTVIPGTLTIAKRTVEVQIDNKTKNAGQSDPELTYTIVDGSLVNNDTLAIELTREEGEEIGSYAISPKSVSVSDNYELTIHNGTLVIDGLEQLYTVRYTDGVDGEEIFADQVYDKLKSGTVTPAFDGTPERKDYTFAGWTPEVAATVTASVTYTATWTENEPEPVMYTVVYTDGVDEEEIFADQSYTVEEGSATPAFDGIPTREGYIFAGWTPEMASTVTANVTYTATWTEDAGETVTYTVTYTDGVGGSVFTNQSYTVEAGTTTPAFAGSPEREGYTFAGWAPEVAATVIEDVTYTALWEENGETEPVEYTVVYTDGVDGEEIFADQTYTAAEGSATPAFDGVPTRKGYTFAGWTPEVAATVTANITYTATWTESIVVPEPTIYTVVYKDGVNGSVFADQTYSVTEGSKTPIFNGTPAREGYTFKGWNPEVAENVTANAVYTAQWEKIKEEQNTQNPTDDEKNNTGNNQQGNSAQDNNHNAEVSNVPRTGDSAHGMMWMILMFGSAFAVVLIAKRKKNA